MGNREWGVLERTGRHRLVDNSSTVKAELMHMAFSALIIMALPGGRGEKCKKAWDGWGISLPCFLQKIQFDRLFRLIKLF